MPNTIFNKAINYISGFAAQARRSGQYSSTAARARVLSRGVTEGLSGARGSLRGAMGGMRSDMRGIVNETMKAGKSLGFHTPGLIGAGVGAAYGGYNDATGRKGPGLVSGALMGAAGGYGYRAATMNSVRSAGQNMMSNARMSKYGFNKGYAGGVRAGVSDYRSGRKAARGWSNIEAGLGGEYY